MLRRLLKTIKTAREPEDVKRARNAAEIVARGAALTLNHVELDYRRLPAFISTKLVGYLHGYSSVICTSWAVQDPGIAIGATMFAIESIFPERREFFIELLSAESLKSAAFVEGGEGGLVGR
ncbi:hypothetical protein KDX16_15465 [Burkholderia vietnamiensis]|jgi:hypothetical protein|uniref:Uncharacterized protein n=2 Tax=Burkholderia cepacia complex TaxID=87882 RepID=A0A228HMD9_9BURK|nr:MULTISPECIES: hypothetical protein [Burkholderia]HDR9758703.1 hypothetical protein [Burkholderia cepacia ATCC 25416]MBR7917221.1 hypothetical protein [Burkholderia vietnamiensis]MBR8054775.1 hypothetical protein [Burkholderia vietnamiensis]MDN7570555.1 hypothetical protein [Burkholderia contaminans]OXI31062.1 hypothetical protein CFB84_42430 [Burkholderia aenigmatica]